MKMMFFLFFFGHILFTEMLLLRGNTSLSDTTLLDTQLTSHFPEHNVLGCQKVRVSAVNLRY